MQKIIIVIIAFALSSCAANDHSRNIPLNVTSKPNSILIMNVYLMVEKSGTETSSAETPTDAKLQLTDGVIK